MADSLNLRKTLGVSRAGQLVAATYSGATNTTLPGNLTVQGVLSNNVSGSLLLRAYDRDGSVFGRDERDRQSSSRCVFRTDQSRRCRPHP